MKAYSVCLCLWPLLSPGAAGSEELTLGDAFARARAGSPALSAARAAVEEARGGLRAAGTLLGANPEVEAARGSRSGTTERDLELSLAQPLDIGRRGPRLAVARSRLAREEAAFEDVLGRALRDVGEAYHRGLHARDALVLAREAAAAAERLHGVARRREAAGEVALLDVNLARLAAGTARAAVHDAETVEVEAQAALARLIGWPPDRTFTLADPPVPPSPALAALLASAASRPDVRALEGERQEAEAEARLAGRSAWPELGLVARYEREAGERVAWGGLSLSLPLFARGQAERGAVAARIERVERDLAAARQSAEREVRAAFAVHEARRAALQGLERDVLLAAVENDGLLQRSYEVGQIGVAELIVSRREGAEARRVWLAARLAAAVADLELQVRAGVLR